jgi:MFS family permease
VTLKLLHNYPNWAVLALGGIVGLVIFGYVYLATDHSKDELTERFRFIRLIGWGLVIFGMGYAIFLTNTNALITPTGIVNRIAIASAVGVAISLVGGIGWVSTFLPSNQLRRRCLCILIALLCTSGFIINNTLASFWIDSYRQQQAIIADIRQRFPTLPSESTLILDGICPYAGPAVVFESSWDLAGALMTFYRDRTLRADVVTPNLKVEENRLSTVLSLQRKTVRLPLWSKDDPPVN